MPLLKIFLNGKDKLHRLFKNAVSLSVIALKTEHTSDCSH